MGYWWIIRYINLWVIAVIMPIWRSCTDRVTSKANIFPICSLSIYSVVLVPIHPAIMHCITPVAFSDNNHLTRGVHFASRKCKTFPWMSLVINVEICRRANSGPPPPSSYVINDVCILKWHWQRFSLGVYLLQSLASRQYCVVMNN